MTELDKAFSFPISNPPYIIITRSNEGRPVSFEMLQKAREEIRRQYRNLRIFPDHIVFECEDRKVILDLQEARYTTFDGDGVEYIII